MKSKVQRAFTQATINWSRYRNLTQSIPANIRFMVARDLKRIDSIERVSFEYPWLNDDFYVKLHEDGVLCYVVEHDGYVIAYAVIRYSGSHIEICSMAVSPDYRRQKVASLVINMLKLKLYLEKRTSIVTYVDDHNMPAQLLFSGCGFRADKVMFDFYSQGHDAYRMVFRP